MAAQLAAQHSMTEQGAFPNMDTKISSARPGELKLFSVLGLAGTPKPEMKQQQAAQPVAPQTPRKRIVSSVPRKAAHRAWLR